MSSSDDEYDEHRDKRRSRNRRGDRSGSDSDSDSSSKRSRGRGRRKAEKGKETSSHKKRYNKDGEDAKKLDPIEPSTGALEPGSFDTRLSLVDNIATLVEKEKAVLQLQLEEKEKELLDAQSTLKKLNEKVEKYELAEMNASIKEQKDALESDEMKQSRKKGEEHMFLLANLRAQHPLPEHVQEAKIVKHLELSKQPVQAAQLDTLQRRLPYLKSIISINLSFTKLSDKLGGPALLSQLLGKKSRIQTLHLNDNMLGEYSFKTICELLPFNTKLKVLNLHNNAFGNLPKGGQQLGQALKNNKSLKHFSVSLYDAITVPNKRGVTYAGNPSTLLGTGMGSSDSSIESLQLSGATITPRSMEIFRKLKAHLFKSLTSLNLSHAYIGPIGTFYLADAISKVKFTTLINLNLSNNRIGCDGAISVGSLLRHNYSITNINLRSNQIQSEGIIGLSKSLEKISKRKVGSPIRSIDLSFNPINVSRNIPVLGKAPSIPC